MFRSSVSRLLSHVPKHASQSTHSHNITQAVVPNMKLVASLPKAVPIHIRTEKEKCDAVTVKKLHQNHPERKLAVHLRTSSANSSGHGKHGRTPAAAAAADASDNGIVEIQVVGGRAHGDNDPIDVLAPAKFHFDVTSDGATVAIDDVEGNVTVASGGGNITLARRIVSEHTLVDSAGGNITLAAIEGRVTLKPGSGNVIGRLISGPVVTLAAGPKGTIELGAVYCDRFEAQLQPGTKLRVGTLLARERCIVHGDAEAISINALELGANASAEVHAQGKIGLQLVSKTGKIAARSDTGDIEMFVPPEACIDNQGPAIAKLDPEVQMLNKSDPKDSVVVSLTASKGSVSLHTQSWEQMIGKKLAAANSKQ